MDNYTAFLIHHMALLSFPMEMTAEEIWQFCLKHQKLFESSTYNNPTRGLYECVDRYVEDVVLNILVRGVWYE